MALTDLASLAKSPYGAAAPMVRARSIIGLEYLVPDIRATLGIKANALAHQAGVAPISGAHDFPGFLNSLGAKSVSLASYRAYTAPSDASSILAKQVLPDNLLIPGTAPNSAADFQFSDRYSANDKNVAPFETMFTAVSSSARSTGYQLTKELVISSVGSPIKDPKNTPFGGVTCDCSAKPKLPANINMFESGVPTNIARAITTSDFQPGSSMRNGYDPA